ncbi:MAG: molybdenum cofactor guanylyltransferase [Chloroflexi bacterium]|nr:molybdenum cofactor guanylyltransferase [Chloroflexota bacterium]
MLSLVIQAGGKSSRMGNDKALMPFLGRPLIERVIQRLIHAANEVLITTNVPEEYRFLNIPLIPDKIPGRGALGGLYTALEAASHPLVAVIACDLPFVNAGILSLAQRALVDTSIDAAIPSTKHGLEPLHAIYRRDTCLPAVKAAIADDQWRLISWHQAVTVHFIGQAEIQRCDPDGIAFWNLNTPQAFQEAESIARLSDQ